RTWQRRAAPRFVLRNVVHELPLLVVGSPVVNFDAFLFPLAGHARNAPADYLTSRAVRWNRRANTRLCTGISHRITESGLPRVQSWLLWQWVTELIDSRSRLPRQPAWPRCCEQL